MTSWAALATALLILLSSFGNLGLPAVAIGDETPAIVQDSAPSDLDQEQKSDDSDDDEEDEDDQEQKSDDSDDDEENEDDQDQDEEDEKDGETLSDTSNGDNTADGSDDGGDEEQNKDTFTDPSDDSDSDEEKTKTDGNEDGDPQQKDADNEQEEKDPTANDPDEDGTVTDPDQENENANIGLTDPDVEEKPADELTEKDEKENTEGLGTKSLTAEAGDAVVTATAAADDSYFPAGAALEVTASREDDLRWTYALHFVDENGDDLALAGAVNVKLTWDEPAAPESLDPDYTYEVKAYQDERETGIRTDSDYRVASVSLETDQDTTVSVVWTKKDRKVPEKKEENHRLSAENDDFKVVVTSKEEEFPEDAELVLTEYTKDNDDHAKEYQEARTAVLEAKKDADPDFDEETLGLRVLDISIRNDGDEWEPDGAVKVSLEMKTLPDGVENGDSLQIQHITEKGEDDSEASSDSSDSSKSGTDDNSDSDSESSGGILSKLNPFRALRKAAKAIVQPVVGQAEMKATTVADAVEAIGGKAEADFTVDGFSVFTITWTISSSTDTRVGYVNVHYVNSTGGVEKDVDSDKIPGSDMMSKYAGDDGIVTISDWAKSSGSSRVSGWNFDKATIGSRTGTEITGLKIAQDSSDSNKYKLWYTSDETVNSSSHWTAYTDSTTGTAASNAEVYLFYEEGAKYPVNVHFMSTSYQPIKDSEGNNLVKIVDGAAFAGSSSDNTGATNGVHDFATKYVSSNVPNGYTFNTGAINTSAAANQIYYYTDSSTSGSENRNNFRYLNYYATDDVYSLYWGRGSGSWTKFDSVPDLYVTFATADNLTVTIHHVDTDGNTVNDDTSASVGDAGTVSISNAVNKDNYTPQSIYYDYTDSSNPGTQFITLTYAKGDTAWTSTKDSDATATTNLVTEVWIVYQKTDTFTVNVHHVNSAGTEIATTTTQDVASNGEITGSSLAKTDITGYSYSNAYFKNGTTSTNFNTLKYSYDSGTDKWSSQYKTTADGTYADTTPSPVYDVYIVYDNSELTRFILHRVDESGARLAADYPVSLTTSNSNPGNFNNGWQGFGNILNYSQGLLSSSVAGSLLRGYIGYFGNSTYQIASGNSLNYFYDSTGKKWHTGSGNGPTSVTKEYLSDGTTATGNNITSSSNVQSNPVLLTDVYQVYSKKGITFHHVDENGETIAADTYGTAANGETVTASDHAQTSVSGWALKDAHLESYTGTTFTSLTYSYDNSKASAQRWSSVYSNSASDPVTADVATGDIVNEVWLVYKTGANFTVHYVDTSGAGTNEADKTFSLGTDGTKKLTSADVVNQSANPNDIAPFSVTQGSGSSEKTLDYVETRLGAYNGPTVDSVEVDSSGNVSYHNTVNGTAYYAQKAGRWSMTAGTGRTLTVIRNGSGDYSIEDSQTGDITNLTLQSGTADENDSVYVATFHGEDDTTEYRVEMAASTYAVTGNETGEEGTFHTYQHVMKVTLEDTLPSKNRDIYQVYGDGSGLALTIDDDIAYSGLFKVVPSNEAEWTLAGWYKDDNGDWQSHTVSDRVYTWHRKTTTINADGTDGTTTDEVVARKQTGDNYNIAYDANDRTWLDIAADEGDDVWTADTRISYYVTLDYKVNDVQQTQIVSNEQTVNYYGRLENGSFETPDLGTGSGLSTSNASYKNQHGVWQTTGTDSNTTRAYDIEIINSGGTTWNASAYNWYESTFENPSSFTSGNVAKDGTQFAELNAENAGALYQDVITHPNETLSYGLSHRARGKNRNANAEYDTMYLVIMPTSLAMTSSSTGGELKTQADLETFINNHGGYSNTAVNGLEDEIIWQDYENGILIRKITSSDQAWHDIDVANGYMTTSSLTRFFFVAGPTAADQGRTIYTQGNFLDRVYFSQSLPVTTGFNLTVTKTFTGLTQEEVANLASSKNGATNANPFTFTITNQNTNTSVSDAMKVNDALKDVTLSFTAVSTGSGTYDFTPTASSGLTSENWRRDSSGNIVMYWTFSDQALQVGTTTATDQTFAYTVKETNTDLTGKSVTANGTVTLTGGSSTHTEAGTTSAKAHITSGATAAYTFTNVYRDNSSDDPPQIKVRKVFSGATRATVDKLLSGNPAYSVTLTKTAGADDTAISSSQPSITLNADTTSLPSNVSYSESVDSVGRVVLEWIITSTINPGTSGYNNAMGTPGTYTVSETGYTPTQAQLNGDNNKLSVIKVNESSSGVTLADSSGITTSDLATSVTATKTEVVAGSSSVSAINPTTTSEGVMTVSADTTVTLGTTTNIIIAKTSFGSGGYLVWTADTLGADLRQAVVNFINATDGLGTGVGGVTASLGSNNLSGNVSFRSGANPGSLVYDSTNAGILGISYDSTSGALSLTNQPQIGEGENITQAAASWTAYYAGTYTASDTQTAEFRIANVYDPIVKIKKIGSTDADTLSGAVFRLYKLDGSTKKYYLTNSSQATPQWGEVDVSKAANTSGTRNNTYETSDIAMSFTTGSDGIVTIGALPKESSAVTYYLEEVTAPNGYNKLVKPVSFTVNTDGTVVIGTAEDAVDNSKATVTYPDPYYVITVSNQVGYKLPDTGGRGTWPFIYSGLALILLAGVWMWLKYLRSIKLYNARVDERRKRGDQK